MDCSPPGSSVHGISKARGELLVPSPGDLPDPGIELRLCLTGGFFTTEPLGKQSFRTISTKTLTMSQVDQ